MQVGKNFESNGLIFSPGEIQKLNIVKTLLRESKILILDEPSSSMDAIAEGQIINNVFDMANDKSLIFISHRLSNLKNVDKIIFLENGKILEIGSHDELIKLEKGAYKKMYEIQAQKYL